MIRWCMRINREVVEQRTLFDLPWSHHRLSSCLNRTESMSLRPFNQRLFQHGVIPGSSQTKAQGISSLETYGPSSCGLATMESDNGILCRTGRVVEADV